MITGVWEIQTSVVSKLEIHRADVWFQCESKCPRTKRVNGVSSILKASRLETKEELIFQSKFEGWKRSAQEIK